MIKDIIQKTAIYSSKKLIRNEISKKLHVEKLESELVKKLDKNKEYFLYMHIPFCITFCPYCSFHKYKYDSDKCKSYFRSLRVEMQNAKDEGFHFNSLYVGGGTPLIDEEELLKTLELAKKLFDIKEISCETDPNHIDPDVLKNFKGLIDRLSIGVQTFDDFISKRVHRYDKFGSSEILQEKISKIQGMFKYTNIDLIFNFPFQTKKMLINDLKIAKNLKIEQITTYPLMSSSITKNKIKSAFENQSANKEYEFYKIIKEELKDYFPNNAWSFSKEKTSLNDEYVSKNHEYIGLGSGAFSFINKQLYINEFDLKKYSELISLKKHTIAARSSFCFRDCIRYHFLTQFFTGSLDIQKFNKSFCVSILDELYLEINFLKKMDAIYIKDNIIYPTSFGEYLSVVMMKEFYAGMDKVREMFKTTINQKAYDEILQ